MVTERLHYPPQPSLPREAPWREVEEIIDLLKATAQKLDALISIYTGAPPPEIIITPTPPAPPITVNAIVPNLKTIATGQMKVPTAGTPVQLPSLEIVDGYPVTIIAKTGNTGYIYWGKSKADCKDSNMRGDGLSSGLAISLRIKNLDAVWIDASVADEGVSWTFERDY